MWMSDPKRASILRQPIGRWLLVWVIAGYIVLCFALFFLYVKPSFLGANHLRIGADSYTYLVMAGVLHDGADLKNVALVTLSGNFLGPVLIARLIPSLTGIACLNLTLFLIGLWIADALPGVKTGLFFFAMILNPLTTPSLLTLNKEILAFFSVMLLLRYVSSTNRSRLLLVAVLLTSMMAIWEQTLVTVFFLAVEHKRSPLRGRHWLTLFFMIACITVLYPILVSTATVDMASLISMASGTIMPRLNEIQAHYGFALIVIPKILVNMWGMVLRPSYFWTDYLHGDFADLQNYVAIPFHTVSMFIVSMIAVGRRKLDIRKQSVFWMAIYLVATAATPLFQPRYQFPVYVVLCLEICGFAEPLSHPAREVSPKFLSIRKVASQQQG